MDEQLEYRDELNLKINELEKKLDLLIKHLTIKNIETTDKPEEIKTHPDKALCIKKIDSIDQINEHNIVNSTLYPNSRVVRFPAMDLKKNWKIKWPEYKPPNYTSEQVLLDKNTDNDLTNIAINQRPFLNFNSFDYVNEIDRKSCLGEYFLEHGLPKNPKGRTGIEGILII